MWSALKLLIIFAQVAFLTAKFVFYLNNKLNKKPNPVDPSASDEKAVNSEAEDTTRKQPKRPRKVVKAAANAKTVKLNAQPVSKDKQLIIFYSTLVGTTEKIANSVRDRLQPIMKLPIEVLDLNYVEDLDKYFASPMAELKGSTYLFVVPSYEIEAPLDAVIEMLTNLISDAEIMLPLRMLAGFSVFGTGDSESWGEPVKFGYQAKQLDKLLAQLGGRRILPLGLGCVKTTLSKKLDEYLSLIENEFNEPSEDIEFDLEDFEVEKGSNLGDLEDIGGSAPEEMDMNKEMVAKDSPTYKALTKQGYTIVGTHSGVKTCRWTKHALRGRGFCYKYAFYGIRSHLCMETTPSLSCSNKCVFCWRHGTNPIGTQWRWQIDPPEKILEGALAGHYQKIKQMRGVPGVQADRFVEAFTAKHCALSLVGEPIFYPHINEFVEMLHDREISSFLVCNAQHPKELSQLKRVTQLYVSIDAADKKTLKKIDRPLHRDFWERFMECLDLIKSRTDLRTVYRMTLVKGFNVSEVEGYADLIERGQPNFVEIKGVTFTGATNPLRMSNVPFYDEVVNFVESLALELQNRNLGYEIATEHAHSCCILLAKTDFKINGKWHTHIDYQKFFSLLKENKPFGPMDYIAETPSFALYGSKEQGFSPDDIRYRGH